MPKPKLQPKSKYITYPNRRNKETDQSYKERVIDFLNSETPSSYITQVALALVILGGIVAVATVAPGLSIVAREFRRSKHYSKKQLDDAIYNLKRGGYVEHKANHKEISRIHLTKKGETYFQKILFEEVKLPEPKHWNGKWTFVLFDIPIQYTKAREALRSRLKMLGFYQYQKSVWVYPHPCEKEILYVADYFGVGKFVEVLSVDHLSKDEDLKKHFDV